MPLTHQKTDFKPVVPDYVAPRTAGRPKTAVVDAGRQMKIKKGEQLLILQKKNSQTSTAVLGIISVVFLIVLGAALIVVAWMFDIEDLYITGAIFLVGATLFGMIILTSNCTQLCAERRTTRRIEQDIARMEQP